MIIDGRRSEGLPDTTYDLVIIGAGPAGITLARELDNTGLRIALLESGGEDYDDAAQALNSGVIEGNDDYDLEFSRLRALGGTSNHWGGMCLPLDTLDFERSWHGLSGWPISRAALDPFYQRAHDYCDLGSYQYDLDALVPSTPDLRLMPDVPEVQTSVARRSPPTRFGDKYRAFLDASETVHLWLWTTAVQVSTDNAGKEWVDTQALQGPARRFSARTVVLASGAIEATRLMLWSNVQNGTSVGDAGGFLGACYMDHLAGSTGFLHFTERQSDKLYWMPERAFADAGVPLMFIWRLSDDHIAETGRPNGHFFVFAQADDPKTQARRSEGRRALDSLKSLVKWTIGRDPGPGFGVTDAYCTTVKGADDYVVDQARALISGGDVSRAFLKFEFEQTPDRANTLRLDPDARDATGLPRPILTWSPSAHDLDGIQSTATEIGRLAGATGLGRLEIDPHDDHPYRGIGSGWHQMGTLRMSESPTSGVVDTDCRVHGAGALYVASGAVIPVSGRANPTLTIVALSIRLADHLKETLG